MKTVSTDWTRVAPAAALSPGRGVGALVGSSCVALFLAPDGAVYGLGGIDPVSGANVIARGLVGSTTIDGQDVLFVASPLDKRRYRLIDGRPVDASDPRPGLDSWPVRVVEGTVEVGLCAAAADRAA